MYYNLRCRSIMVFPFYFCFFLFGIQPKGVYISHLEGFLGNILCSYFRLFLSLCVRIFTLTLTLLFNMCPFVSSGM